MGIKDQGPTVFLAPLKTNTRITPHHFLMSFHLPRIARSASPGQFLMVSLGDHCDPLLPRPFAVYNIDGDCVEVLYRRVGKGTTLLADRRAGDVVRILGPLGRGFALGKDLAEGKDLADIRVVAGGTGIASLYFLMKQSLQRGVAVSLFYGAGSHREMLPLRELQSLGLRLHVVTEDGSIGYCGTVSDLFASFLRDQAPRPSQRTHTFVCGPASMMAAVADLLRHSDLPGQFSLESRMACGYGACQGCVVETTTMNERNEPTYQRVCTEGPVFTLGEIRWDRLVEGPARKR